MIVDDSALMRRLLTDLLSSAPEIEIVGTARDGREAVLQAARLKPDVITLDVEMPEVSGLEALPALLAVHEAPVVMVSALTQEGADVTLQALELGAVDFMPKPERNQLAEMRASRDLLVAKVLAAVAKPGSPATADVRRHRALRRPGDLPQPGAYKHSARARGRLALQQQRHQHQHLFPARCVSSLASPPADHRHLARCFRCWFLPCHPFWLFSTCRRSLRASSPNGSIGTAPYRSNRQKRETRYFQTGS